MLDEAVRLANVEVTAWWRCLVSWADQLVRVGVAVPSSQIFGVKLLGKDIVLQSNDFTSFYLAISILFPYLQNCYESVIYTWSL